MVRIGGKGWVTRKMLGGAQGLKGAVNIIVYTTVIKVDEVS
jgi:hypothetical protein